MPELAACWWCPRCERTWISATGFSSNRCPGCKKRKDGIWARPHGMTPEERLEKRREYQRNLSAEQRARKTERQRERRQGKSSSE